MEIAIVIIAYNRDHSLRRLLKSLELAYYDNEKVDLIISIDKTNNTKVNKIAEKFKWRHGNKKIILHRKKLGLRNHVLKAGDIVFDYDAIIMLEDDLLVSKSFYRYAMQTVSFYKDDIDIGGISLYSYRISEFANYRTFIPMQDDSDIFFMSVPSSWGQIWTRNQWKMFKNWYDHKEYNNMDYSGIIPDVALKWGESSWKKYFYMYIAQYKKYIVYPRVALSTNMADVGTHHKSNTTFHQTILMGTFNRNYILKKLKESDCVYDSFFENTKLNNYLDLKEDLIVDYFGIKKKYNNSRYLLSTRKLDYKIVKQWNLSLKPYELNIIYDIKGNGIFLYDLTERSKNNVENNIVNQIKYELPGITKEKSLKVVFSDYFNALKRKLSKLIRI